MTEYLLHRRVNMQGHAIAQLRQHGTEVLPRAARHHIPLRAIGDIQQTVMLKEAQKQRQRKTTHLLKRARPDGSAHWQNVMTGKKRAEAVLFQERLERGVFVNIAHQRGFRLTVKARDIFQQPPESRIDQITALGKKRREGVPVVFQTALRIMYREAHLGFLPANTQLAEQAHKARIGAIVVDNKPGINRISALRRGDIDRRGMPAGRRCGLENRDLVMPGQTPGAGHPGDAAANNRDIHERTIRRSRAR